MKLGICWNGHSKLSANEQAGLMAENGFESTFIKSDEPAVSEVISVLKKQNISCESMHAPTKNINLIWYDNGEEGEAVLDMLKGAVDSCAKNEVPILVSHLSSKVAPRVSDIGFERFSRLMEHARTRGVRIAYENQRYLANIALIMEQFEDAVFCWDTGHQACFTPKYEFIKLFGDRLNFLHLHDNRRIYNHDDHLLPFDAAIDFDYVAKSIAGTSFHGSVMLEVTQNNERYQSISPKDFYPRAYQSAMAVNKAIAAYRVERGEK